LNVHRLAVPPNEDILLGTGAPLVLARQIIVAAVAVPRPQPPCWHSNCERKKNIRIKYRYFGGVVLVK